MRTLLGLSILFMLWPQTSTHENKPTVASGSPVGLTIETFRKLYPSARCFFADDNKPETLEFCFVEPAKGDKIMLFDRFSVIKGMVTFGKGKVKEITATLDEKITNVTRYLDEVSPKADMIKDCVERVDQIAKHEAEFHTQGIPEPDRAHYQDELRQATRAYNALGCGNLSAEHLTSWKYRGEEITVTTTLPEWARSIPQRDGTTVIKIVPLAWSLDRDRPGFH
jgi:hypothetical protein